jgi:ComF family protein
MTGTSRPYCPRCGIAAGPFLSDETGCPECRRTRIRPEGFARVGAYHDLIGQTLRRFKFNREHRLDGALGRLLSAAIEGRPWRGELDAVIPVPTDWRGRVRYRAWPVGMIATQVARQLRVPAIAVLQVKGKRHRQVGLPQSLRHENIRGIFRVKRRARLDGANVCIIDDVSTTGSTVLEITSVLREAGAARVYAAVIAKTDPQRDDADPL